MTEPKNGDFASFLQQNQSKAVHLKQELMESATALHPVDQVEGVLNVSAETLMDDEAVERLAAQMRETEQALSTLPPMTDEELDRQALEAGGADNDPDTPE
jgi:hypothetical protein